MANKKAFDLLKNSPYKDKLGNAALISEATLRGFDRPPVAD